MSTQDLMKRLQEKEKFKSAFGKKDLAFEVSQLIIESRVRKGMTQGELAKKIGTKQSSIARAENGTSLPSLRFLQKIAEAYGNYLLPPRFGFMPEYTFSFQTPMEVALNQKLETHVTSVFSQLNEWDASKQQSGIRGVAIETNASLLTRQAVSKAFT